MGNASRIETALIEVHVLIPYAVLLLVKSALMEEVLLVRLGISDVPVNSRYCIPDIAVRGVSIEAVLLILPGISDRPGNIAGTAFLTFLIDCFNQCILLT